MKEIELTKGFKTKVDDEDFEELNKYKWYATKCCDAYYAKRVQSGKQVNRKWVKKNVNIYMHRLLLGLKRGDKRLADHKDRDTLNNQKNNLRIATWAENQRNKTKKRNATSKYIGVTKLKNGKYLAQLTFKGKHVRIGQFDIEVEAARAYDISAKKYHGEFANINNV
jgi:hypothetical protein